MDSVTIIRNKLALGKLQRCPGPMSRGYRYIILAAGWLVLTAAGEPANQNVVPRQMDAGNEQPKRANVIPPPAAASGQPIGARKIQCGNGRYAGNDELCAQWKAADAAADAARWAYWQMVLSGFGIIGLGITLVFNLAAWRQARDARKEAQQAMELAREQARARVTLLPSNFSLPAIIAQSEVTPERAPDRPTIVLQFQNSGKSEATILEVRANHMIGPHPFDGPPFHQTPVIHIADLTISAEDVSEHKIIALENLPSAGEISQVRNGWFLAYFYGHIRYADIFGIEHETAWCMRSERDGNYRYWGGDKYNFRT